MAFPGASLTIIYTVLLHFTVVGTNSWLLSIITSFARIIPLLVQGLVFISYPLLGLLADVKLTRYRMIHLSCWAIFIAHLLLIVEGVISLVSDIVIEHFAFSFLIIAILTVFGKGMFESTVIQFGTDQMIEASSTQLSTFIHWYY